MSAPSIYDTPDPLPDGRDYADRVLAELAAVELVAEDGEPMESSWHRDCMNLLIGQVDHHLRDRTDYYVGGNMFIYFNLDHAKNRDFRGPDFFFVWESTRQPGRDFWTVWDEGRGPDVIIELSSPTTRDEDYGEKFEAYRTQLRVSDYFIFDPLTGTLDGWRLEGRRYKPLQPDASGRLWSEELELRLGTWDGTYARDDRTWLRFFDDTGKVVPIREEGEAARAEAEKQRAEGERQRADAEKQRAEGERQRADAEKQRAEGERQRADAEKQRADAEKFRADALAAELARLKEQLTKSAPEAKP